MVYLLAAVSLLPLCVVLLQAEGNVFLEKEHANRILGRMKRANSPFEELWQGDLERECIEEVCSYEEAHEAYENDLATEIFWKKYRGNPCFSNPCQHEGKCIHYGDDYQCLCFRGTEGINCETVSYEDCRINNGRCDQFCSMSAENKRVDCSCTTGYRLGENRKSCIPAEQFVCGRRYSTNGQPPERQKRQIANATKNGGVHSGKPVTNTKTNDVKEGEPMYARYMQELYWQSRRLYGRPGEFPWQAMLVNEHNESFCGGTVLNPHFILTAAHCANVTEYFYAVVGAVDMRDPSRSTHEVDLILLHSKFDPETYDYDIALIKVKEAITFSARVVPACIPEENLAEHVLMTKPSGYVSSFTCPNEYRKHNTKLQVHYVPFSHGLQCGSSNSTTITANMFCAVSDIICQEGFGNPYITLYKGTSFVTGIASRRVRNNNGETYGVFTKVSPFINWIKRSMCYF